MARTFYNQCQFSGGSMFNYVNEVSRWKNWTYITLNNSVCC